MRLVRQFPLPMFNGLPRCLHFWQTSCDTGQYAQNTRQQRSTPNIKPINLGHNSTHANYGNCRLADRAQCADTRSNPKLFCHLYTPHSIFTRTPMIAVPVTPTPHKMAVSFVFITANSTSFSAMRSSNFLTLLVSSCSSNSNLYSPHLLNWSSQRQFALFSANENMPGAYALSPSYVMNSSSIPTVTPSR